LIATVFQNPLVAIDEGDSALAGRRIHKGRIICHQAEVIGGSFDLAQVHGLEGAVFNRHFVILSRAIVGDCQGLSVHRLSSPVVVDFQSEAFKAD
jgi:hypothetical protein